MVQDRRAARREETIRAILDAAWAQCAEVGVGELSLRKLARSVGMKAPSLYVYFDSKDALYDALFADAAIEFRDLYAAAVAKDDVEEAWRSALECYLRFALENPAKFQLHFQRPIPNFQPSDTSFSIARETYTMLVELLERTVAAGVLDREVLERRSLDLITAISSGLASQQLSNEPDADLRTGRWTSLIPEVMEMQKRFFAPRKEK